VQEVVVVVVEVLSELVVLLLLLPLEDELVLSLEQASTRTGRAATPARRLLMNLALVCSMMFFFMVTGSRKG
jgi:hypothetical protein